MFVSLKFTAELLTRSNAWFLKIVGRMNGYQGTVEVPLYEAGEHTLLLIKPEDKPQVSFKRLRRASMKQEEKVAAMHGGHRNLGSGSVPGRASDASIREKFRIENKLTTKKGFRITLADLFKIRSECERGQVPVYQIDFKEPGTLVTKDQWVLVPLAEWEKRIASEVADG